MTLPHAPAFPYTLREDISWILQKLTVKNVTHTNIPSSTSKVLMSKHLINQRTREHQGSRYSMAQDVQAGLEPYPSESGEIGVSNGLIAECAECGAWSAGWDDKLNATSCLPFSFVPFLSFSSCIVILGSFVDRISSFSLCRSKLIAFRSRFCENVVEAYAYAVARGPDGHGFEAIRSPR